MIALETVSRMFLSLWLNFGCSHWIPIERQSEMNQIMRFSEKQIWKRKILDPKLFLVPFCYFSLCVHTQFSGFSRLDNWHNLNKTLILDVIQDNCINLQASEYLGENCLAVIAKSCYLTTFDTKACLYACTPLHGW